MSSDGIDVPDRVARARGMPAPPHSHSRADPRRTALMRFRSAATVAVICCCISSAPIRARAQGRVTPGTVARLVEPKGIADLNALRDAISNADPAVRVVAARVAGIRTRSDLAGELQELLASEENADVAREQVRALLFLKGLEVLPQAKAAVTRLGGPVAATVGEWLARTQPDVFAATLAELLRSVPESETEAFAAIVVLAIRQTPSARDNISQAYAAVAPGPGWRELLRSFGADADALVLKRGLTAPRGVVREATVWFAVADPSITRTVATTALQWMKTPAQGEPLTDDTEWAVFGRELLARRSGKPAATDGAEVIRRNGLKNLTDTRTLAGIPELTAAERFALRDILPDLPVTPRVTTKPPRNPSAAVGIGPPTRTFPVIAPGLLGSLLEALGCTLPASASAFGAAGISYQPDGRPRAISVGSTTLTEPCAPFVKILAMLTIAPTDQPVPDGEAQWMFIPMNREAIDCLDEGSGPSRGRSAVRASGGSIKTPLKIKDVRPVYPVSMQQARVSGIVILEATITATGCVQDAQILRSIQLPLDLAALQAVLGWRFEPTLLDGTPVPFIMTVTVNFTLR